jgi:4-diphosphocytidyl-2-C-methyl-D-erythritol kinase
MKSYAKINLYLEITGRRPDGYHLLDSLMVLIDIFDVISITESANLELEIKGQNADFLKSNWQENIIIKTVNLLAKKYHFLPQIKITLEKNIPVAAGLGGGSSNAATIIVMLNEFYNLQLSRAEMLELGLQIGADVPFFLNANFQKNSATFVSGVGEILENAELELADLPLLIINPNQYLSTKEIFELFASEGVSSKPKSHQKHQDIFTLIQNRRNDLQNPAIKTMPEIGLILESLEKENCVLSRMSGAGASCFAVFENDENLEKTYQKLQKTFPNFYLKKTKIIG